MSSRVYLFFNFLHAAMNLRPPSVTVSTHTSAFKAVAFSPPLCQTPGCRSGRNRSTLSPSHPVLSALHPQGFRIRFASAAARRSFGGASPPTKVFSLATSSQFSQTRLSQGHGCVCVCVCVFFPSILDIKFVGRTSRGHTGGRSHRIFNPPSFCGACLDFCREKDSAIPFPRRP